MIEKMNHMSDRGDMGAIPVQVERKIKACKEIMHRIDHGEWEGKINSTDADVSGFRTYVNNIMKDLA